MVLQSSGAWPGSTVARLSEDDAGATGHEHGIVVVARLHGEVEDELGGEALGDGVVDKVPSKIDVAAPASPRRGRGFKVLGSMDSSSSARPVATRSGNGGERRLWQAL